MPVTLSTPPMSTPSSAYWRTIQVDGAPGNPAPPTDYVANSGVVQFAPGQTTATISVDVTGNSTGAPEYVVLSLSSPRTREHRRLLGPRVHHDQPVADGPPGRRDRGPADERHHHPRRPGQPLDAVLSEAVTVHWTTLHVDGLSGEAPVGDYGAASGTVTFAPGQTMASVPITVLGNSTGADELIVVSFTNPTNAVMGGFWGLGRPHQLRLTLRSRGA